MPPTGPHGGAAVGRQTVPGQGRLLPAEEATQLAQDLNQAVGVVVAGLDVEGKLGAAAADAITERGRLDAFSWLNVWSRWVAGRAAPRSGARSGSGCARIRRRRPGRLCAVGRCLIAGQRCLTQRSMASWSRSVARRLGAARSSRAGGAAAPHVRGMVLHPGQPVDDQRDPLQAPPLPTNPLAVAPSSRRLGPGRAERRTAWAPGRSVRGCAARRCRLDASGRARC
jgi:hypothetical protein